VEAFQREKQEKRTVVVNSCKPAGVNGTGKRGEIKSNRLLPPTKGGEGGRCGRNPFPCPKKRRGANAGGKKGGDALVLPAPPRGGGGIRNDGEYCTSHHGGAAIFLVSKEGRYTCNEKAGSPLRERGKGIVNFARRTKKRGTIPTSKKRKKTDYFECKGTNQFWWIKKGEAPQKEPASSARKRISISTSKFFW